MTVNIMPFGATSTATEVLEGIDLTGKRAIVTGAYSGIGFESAVALAAVGAEVTLAVRNPEAGADAARKINDVTGRDDVHVSRIDLIDRSSIREFVSAWSGPLDILINNAGVMALPELHRTLEGWEAQFATNHLGSAALTLGLHDALAAAGNARVVMVCSSAHLMAPVDFDDIHFESRPYEAWAAYAQSKTATLLFTVALARRWGADGITVNALHPGGIMTNLQRHLDDAALAFVGAKDDKGNTLDVPPGWKTPQQGAATTVLLAGSPLVEGVSGRYFEDVNEAAVQPEPAGGKAGVAPYAVDAETAEHLWDVTAQLLA
ncbi:SDR family NAD(P)-dependent oxidoreductase [Glaciibacter superstes]|uniref:SDR family NAD(P)-dependent oxidoreductase n=1 Tax=Glaciibacter superstes TaxID=501023 RepID=UPI0003B639DC|nr:SDR family NAD(P)-dependent oxidoreductase [Glaciibacter superstes]